MITFFKSWCEGIIIAVIISIIIESILPEGSNKKYIKVVIGIYIVFTILNPILGNKIDNVNFDNVLDLDMSKEIATVNTKDIQNLYANGIEENLKNDLENEFGYVINTIEIIFDEKYENIEKINLSIKNNNIQNIEKVEIGQNKKEKQTDNYDNVKKYILENYEVTENKIFIN